MGANNGNGVGGGNNGGLSLRVSAAQSCAVLFRMMPPLDEQALLLAAESWVGACEVETTPVLSRTLVAGTVQFGAHRIVMLARPSPLGQETLERTVRVSPMPEELRDELEGHGAAVRLMYVGDSSTPVEQLSALYAIAGALLEMGGIGIVNERAALALPAELAGQYLARLGEVTPPIELWVGAVTFQLDESGGMERQRLLMRTYGMGQMRLPDLGTLMHDRAGADDAHHTLLNICLYMVEGASGEPVGAGERVDFGGRTYLMTEPGDELSEIAGEGVLMVVEV